MASQAVSNDAYVDEHISTKTSYVRVCWALNKAVHMDCFDVFIIVLVIVIFSCSSSSYLVTTFELSHILTNILNNVF